MMNKKAKELGLQNTNFVTPHGLDEAEHYTTAYELAKIADYALNNKKFANIVSTKTTTININGQQKSVNNTNELLGYLNGVDGIKTGFTNNAGRCLVTSTTRNGHQIICVVLGADTKKIRTNDSIKLIEYAFSKFEYINIAQKIEEEFQKWCIDNVDNIEIVKGRIDNISLGLDNINVTEVPINKKDVKDLKVETQCQNIINAPIEENQKLGKVQVKLKDEIIAEVDIISKVCIKKKNCLVYLKQLLLNYNKYIKQSF